MKKKLKLNLKTANQVDGKIHPEDANDYDVSKDVPTTLSQLWGERDNKYESKSEEEYTQYLNELNTAELRTHAIQVA
ncbi:MAG: hypothetical protein AABY22_10770, partial [Nanoarchaeota archaeon]